MGFLRRDNNLPQVGGPSERRYGTDISLYLWIMSGILVILILIIAAPLWLPAIRWFVPDRYVMAYAPEALQPIIFRIDIGEQVPTPVPASDEAAGLAEIAALPPTPTPDLSVVTIPEGGGGGGGGQYVQPTAVPVAPTPTATPVSGPRPESGAVDLENEADLSQADALLKGFTFVQQTGVNNCGPASFATMISYWGIELTLEEVRPILKPNPEDPNVRPDELKTYAESLGYQMLIRDNGDFELIKRFILAGYPVLIETGYDPEPDTIGWTSHFLTLVGYSESQGGFIAMDTYRRPNWFYPYEEIGRFWREFNRRYMIAYRPDQAAAVASIVGEDMDEIVNNTNAMRNAQLELSLDREDPYSWFNLGSSLTNLGRYEEATLAFDEARRLGLPWRFLWYQFTPFEAYLAVGRYEDVMTLADAVTQKIATEEPYYYRGLAYAAQGDTAKARGQFEQALRLNNTYTAAQIALDSLEGS